MVPVNMWYAGIGSRQTPAAMLEYFTRLATQLGKLGFGLRSGGADGADTAFANGADYRMRQIYLPWPNFNGHEADDPDVGPFPTTREYDIAREFHPAWHRCSRGARALHARNVLQVLGPHQHAHSAFIVCWTPNGEHRGGTAQALRIAEHYEIPVFNFGSLDRSGRVTGPALSDRREEHSRFLPKVPSNRRAHPRTTQLFYPGSWVC